MMSQVIRSTPSPVQVSVQCDLAAGPGCDASSPCSWRGGVTVHHNES